MSFNLMEKNARKKVEEKIQTIEKMLQDNFGEYSKLIREETLEVNIDKDHVEKKTAETTESLLKSRQVGSEIAVTEKKLNTEKGLYNKLRDPVCGDVCPLEKKRLDSNPVEKEKSKKANK